MIRFLALAFLGFLATACTREDILRKIAPPEQQDIARAYIEKLRNHDFADIERAMDPSIAGELQGGVLEKIAGVIPEGEPTSVKLVGANQFSYKDAGTALNLTYEFQFGDEFLLINVARATKDGADTIVGLGVHPLSASLEEQNRFTLANKNVLQYGMLVTAIGVAIFTLVALVTCIKTKLASRKWLWILFIVLGFGKIMVNWTTGQWSITIFAVQLFGASAMAEYSGAWIIAVSLPIGAAVFLSRRKELA